MALSENDIDQLYSYMLKRELEDIVSVTDKAPQSVYTGEQAFALMVHCVQSDYSDSVSKRLYKIKIEGLNKDTLIRIINSLCDVFPEGSIPVRPKRCTLKKELSSMGMAHMTGCITSKRDRTYTLEIRHLSYTQCSRACKVLFCW